MTSSSSSVGEASLLVLLLLATRLIRPEEGPTDGGRGGTNGCWLIIHRGREEEGSHRSPFPSILLLFGSTRERPNRLFPSPTPTLILLSACAFDIIPSFGREFGTRGRRERIERTRPPSLSRSLATSARFSSGDIFMRCVQHLHCYTTPFLSISLSLSQRTVIRVCLPIMRRV